MATERIDAIQLDITSKTTSDNIDKLIDSLTKLGSALDKLKSKSITVDVNNTNMAVNKLNSSFATTAIKLTAVIALCKKFGSVISSSVSNSASYIKTLNMFTLSMGEYADSAAKYAQTVSDALGIDPAEWLKTQGTFQSLAKGFGVTGDKAAYLSQQLTQLSYDYSSYWGLTVEEAANKIRAASSGRVEPIRKLGVSPTQPELVDYAKNPKNYGKQTFAINQQTGAIEANTIATGRNTEAKIGNFNQINSGDKFILRTNYLIEQSAHVLGDYSRALNDPYNQLNIFKQQLNQTSRAFGNLFIPMLNKVLPYLSAFAQLATQAFQSLAQLFGFELPDMKERTGINTKDYDSVVKSTGKAKDNAKKMKDYMLGIDELNVFNPNTGAGAGGAGKKGKNTDLSGLLLKGYDFLGKSIENSIKKAKENIQKFFNDLKKNPLELPIKIFALGASELGAAFWEGLLGKSPKQLAADADKWGMTIGQAFILSFTDATANTSADILGLILGKTPEQLGADAQACGMTVGEYIVDGYTKKMNSLGFTSTDSAQSLLDTLLGKPEDLALRAGAAGRSVGDQFHKELALSLMKFFNSNPVSAWLYKITTGREVQSDLAELEKQLGMSAETIGKTFGSALASGFNSSKDIIESAANGAYRSALNGAKDNGKGSEIFKYVSADQAKAYSSSFTSKETKEKVTSASSTMAGYGVKGIESKNKDYTTAGINNTAGYIKGIRALLKEVGEAGADIGAKAIEAAKKKTKTASPSKAFDEIGMFNDLGYAQGVKKYSYMVTDAVSSMANKAVSTMRKASDISNSTITGVSVPTTNNAGYSVGASNESAMASLAGNIYQAVVSGIAGANVGSGNSGDIKVIIDGKEVFKAVQTESRKRGVAVSNGAFSR